MFCTAGTSGSRASSAGTLAPALLDLVAVAEGSARAADGSLALDVETWIASPEQGVSAAVERLDGAVATVGALARLAPSAITVIAAVAAPETCWAEIERRSDDGAETALVGLTYDRRCQISRLIWLRAAVIPAIDTEGDARSWPPARPILEGYFAHLTRSRFEEAAAYFTLDTLYSHPPYAGGRKRVLFRGREALARAFLIERGPSPARQIITGLWQKGARVFVEGVIEGIPDGGSFFSTAQITSGGEIARYVAFYSARRVPRRP